MHVLRNPSPTAAYSFDVVRADESRASLSAAGELDLGAARDLIALLAAQERDGRVYIRLDLSDVTFMDCSCLGILVAAHDRLRAAHGQLILTRSSGPVIRLLSLTHLDEILLASVDGDLPVGRNPALTRTPPRAVPDRGAAR